jgi:hypothetical protein
MIIGLSGRMGSGKDTVGKIIQYLLCKNVGDISLEDVVSCNDHDWWLDEQSKFEIKKFAGKLKAVGSLLTGIPTEKFEDQEFKKTDLPNEWVYIENGYAARNMTVRDFLQKLGTEAMRNGLHTNVWVNALFADYKEELDPYHFKSHINESTLKYPNWILTDMRFPNELESVVERNGITIRVTRPVEKSKTTARLHPSETSLDKAEFDYEIVNDGTIKELAEKVQIILIKEGIL